MFNRYFAVLGVILICSSLLFSCGGSGDKVVVTGKVLDSDGAGVSGVTMTMGTFSATTFASGTYLFSDVDKGHYTIIPSFQGAIFDPVSHDIDVSGFTEVLPNFTVAWRPTTPLNTSTPPTTLFPVDNLQGVSFVNNTYFAVGDKGIILSSTDGKTWTTQASNTQTYSLYGTAFGNSKYVAVGSGGTTLTSANGAAWSASPSPAPATLRDIIFDGGNFIAVGEGGSIFTSTDGFSWNSVSSGVTGTLFRIASLKSKLYSVGASGIIISSSDNGKTWTKLNSGTPNDLHGIALDNVGTYIVVGTSGTVLSSTDGTSWTSHAVDAVGTTDLLDVALGTITTTTNNIATSTDNFVAVGNSPSGDVFVSTDGSKWISKQINSNPTPPQLNRIIFANKAFVAVGNNGVTYWTSNPNPPPQNP